MTLRWPESIDLDDTAKGSVEHWAKQLRVDPDEPNSAMTSELSVTVIASGIGDNFCFSYGGFYARGFYDDFDGEWILIT